MNCISGIMTSTEHFVHQNYILVVCKEYLMYNTTVCYMYNCYRKIFTYVCMCTHQNHACMSLCVIVLCNTCNMHGTCILHMCGIKLVDACTVVANNICTSIYTYYGDVIHQRCCQVNIYAYTQFVYIVILVLYYWNNNKSLWWYCYRK